MTQTIDDIFKQHSQEVDFPHVLFQVFCSDCGIDEHQVGIAGIGKELINLECLTCRDFLGAPGLFIGVVTPGYYYLSDEARDLLQPDSKITRFGR